MTPAQTKLYWREWAAVRRKAPDADRHAIHVQACGYDVSSKDLSNEQFDRVLAAFAVYSRDACLQSQLRQLDQPRRRLLYQVQVEQAAMLAALLGGEDDAGCKAAAGYIAQVTWDKFRLRSVGEVDTRERNRPRSCAGPKSDLETLRDTLAARISALRRAKGWSGHDLCMAAGLQCRCSRCKAALETVPASSPHRMLHQEMV